MDSVDSSPARERVLDVAEQLFSQRGYASVTMRDIAAQLKMKVSSLYYHAPNGKEELFVAVITRNLHRHELGLRAAIERAGSSWQQQLYAAAHWLLEQPPLDMRRFVQSDQHALSPAHAQQLMQGMYVSLFDPIVQIFTRAQAETGTNSPFPGVLAGAFLSLVDGFHNAPPPVPGFPHTPTESLDSVLAVLVKGLEAG